MIKQEWIMKLKVGDLVVLDHGLFNRKTVEKVTHVTPTGLVVVDQMIFNQDGDKRGGNIRSPYITEYTPEVAAKFLVEDKTREDVEYLRSVDFSKLSMDVRSAVIKLIKES